MPRPEFPHCIMPVGVIRAIREMQESYDRDPEEYERWERVKEEERQREDEEYELRCGGNDV